ncbi:putative transposase family protein, partial [Escherichia coli 8.0586]
RH